MNEQTLTAEDARRLLAAERVQRENKAALEIQRVLEKYKCAIHTIIEVGEGSGILSRYKVVAL